MHIVCPDAVVHHGRGEAERAGASVELQGKRVVVLGGTSGIGLATAKAAAKAGAEVTVVSSRQVSVDRALRELPATAAGIVADLTQRDQLQEVFEKAGELDHLVFTAGEPLGNAPLASLDLDAAQQFFQLRFFAALQAAAVAAPRLRAGGSITLTTGVAKDRPLAGWAVTASLCGAMEGLTRALAVELAPIRVNVVSPGFVATPLWSTMPEADREATYRAVADANPVGSVGEPDDIASAYIYLMTQPYATGSVVTVDGGGTLV
jgi:NAD(P)-dependent dehydrogenase (short-subunit alcohol dehydrogenase family)